MKCDSPKTGVERHPGVAKTPRRTDAKLYVNIYFIIFFMRTMSRRFLFDNTGKLMIVKCERKIFKHSQIHWPIRSQWKSARRPKPWTDLCDALGGPCKAASRRRPSLWGQRRGGAAAHPANSSISRTSEATSSDKKYLEKMFNRRK